MCYALFFLALLRLLSFSLMSFFTDGLMALYGLTFLKAFEDPDRIIMLESIIMFELLLAAVTLIGVLTLASLITESTILKVPIVHWQQIAGYVVSGCALAVYLAALLSVHFLYRALKETTLVTQDEASSLFSRDQIGRIHASTGSNPMPVAERFPGKGYRLEV